LKQAVGIVLQNAPQDTESVKYAMRIAKKLNIPLVTHAENAMHLLHEGLQVTLDPEKGIVYKGTLPNL
jgi:pyruvate kinase